MSEDKQYVYNPPDMYAGGPPSDRPYTEPVKNFGSPNQNQSRLYGNNRPHPLSPPSDPGYRKPYIPPSKSDTRLDQYRNPPSFGFEYSPPQAPPGQVKDPPGGPQYPPSLYSGPTYNTRDQRSQTHTNFEDQTNTRSYHKPYNSFTSSHQPQQDFSKSDSHLLLRQYNRHGSQKSSSGSSGFNSPMDDYTYQRPKTPVDTEHSGIYNPGSSGGYTPGSASGYTPGSASGYTPGGYTHSVSVGSSGYTPGSSVGSGGYTPGSSIGGGGYNPGGLGGYTPGGHTTVGFHYERKPGDVPPLSFDEKHEDLVKEVSQLAGEKESFMKDIASLKKQKDELQASVNDLQTREATLKTRLAQAEQNLELMKKLELKNAQQPPESVAKQNDKIKELEMVLREREEKIAKKELELQTEADMLYQRNKELKLKEYDMGSEGANPGRPVTDKEHELYLKQLDMDVREKEINDRERNLEMETKRREMELGKEREKLETWRQTIQLEDSRAQENIKNAQKYLEEVKSLENQVLSASTAVTIEERERNETRQWSRTDRVADDVIQPPSIAPLTVNDSNDTENDEAYARMLLMELNRQAYEASEKLVEQLSMREERPPTPPEDVDFLLTFQKQELGLSPDATKEDVERRLKEIEASRQSSAT